MKILRYEASMAGRWDEFVDRSKNGTFLLRRAYMDYHADRFEDHSLVFCTDGGDWLAVLPANKAGSRLSSHDGLTYGGFVSGPRMTTPAMLECFDALLAYLRSGGFTALRYKTIPHIYASHPAEEDRYALFRLGARLYRRDVLAVALPGQPLPYQERRTRKMKQAAKAGLELKREIDFAPFWRVLEANLESVHGAKPVHSLAEITLLAGRFPGNIGLHVVREGGEAVAGVVVYDTGRVAHVQYIGSNAQGRELGALDLLFPALIQQEYAKRPYFDFGISNEDDGKVLNVGLIEQKEGFGARAVAHDFYEVDIS